MWFQIFFTFVCLLAVVVLTSLIISNNKEYDGKVAPGWWMISICMSQIFLVAIMSIWWKEWWIAHQLLMKISAGLAMVGIILWVIAKIYTKHH